MGDRRRALAGLASAAAGAVVAPTQARAWGTPLDYAFEGPAPERGLGLAPPLACTPGTPAQTEGPFYTPKTPRRATLREPGTAGEPLAVQGLVLTPDCRPVAGAVIDIWHCDERGDYDNRGFRYRGHQFTDAAGAFRFETIRPVRYGGRTPHIHVKVQGEATRLLTTQVYFPDMTWEARCQRRRRHLPGRADDAARVAPRPCRRRLASTGAFRFDFVLTPA